MFKSFQCFLQSERENSSSLTADRKSLMIFYLHNCPYWKHLNNHRPFLSPFPLLCLKCPNYFCFSCKTPLRHYLVPEAFLDFFSFPTYLVFVELPLTFSSFFCQCYEHIACQWSFIILLEIHLYSTGFYRLHYSIFSHGLVQSLAPQIYDFQWRSKYIWLFISLVMFLRYKRLQRRRACMTLFFSLSTSY